MLVRRMRDENGRFFMRRATLLDHIDYFIIRHIAWLLPLVIVLNILFAALILRSI